MRKTATPFAAALLAATCLGASFRAVAEDAPAPPAAPGAPPAELRPGEVLFRPLVGRTYWFTLRTSFHSEHKAGKERAVCDGATTNDVLLTFGARGTDGFVPAKVRVTRTTGSWVDPKHPKIEFDTDVAPVPHDSGASQLIRYLAPASFRVRADGRIVEIDDLVERQARAPSLARTDPERQEFEKLWFDWTALPPFAGTWPVLPPKRMGAGTFFETASLAPWPLAPLYRLNLRHEVKSIDDARVVFDTKGGVDDLDPANQAGKSKKKDGASTGPRIKVSGFGQSSAVDRADGVVRKSSARFTLIRTQTFSVDGDSAEGTATFTWEATIERRDAPASSEPPPTPAPASPPAAPDPPK